MKTIEVGSLDFSTKKTGEIVRISDEFVAGDSAYQLSMVARENGATKSLNGYTARIRFKTESGYTADEPCEISGSSITYHMLGAQLVCGEVLGIVSLYLNEQRESSCKFSFRVLDDLNSDESVRDSKQYSELEREIGKAQMATNAANDAADAANDAAAEANELFIHVNAAKVAANTAAETANNAANAATTAAGTANTAAAAANAAKEAANTATTAANAAATSANAAANAATEAAESAGSAAYAANAKAEQADIARAEAYAAANSANLAAQNANTAANAASESEESRQSAETARVTAESARAENETARQSAETARATAESARAAAETSRNETFDEYIAAIDEVTKNGPVLSVNGETGVVSVGKADVGLGNVDNTADLDKPVSTAQAEALETKQDICYCTCDTAADTEEKVVTIVEGDAETFAYTVGRAIDVKFENTNDAKSPTLNVNGLGEKPIISYYLSSGAIPPEPRIWRSGTMVRFVYDGTGWVIPGGTNATTGYYGLTKLNNTTSSTSPREAATANVAKMIWDEVMLTEDEMYDLFNAAIPKAQKGAKNGVASLGTDGKVPIAQLPDGLGLLPRLDITTASGTTVTVMDGTTTLTGTSTGTISFELPNFGDWTITVGNYSKTLRVDTVKVYEIMTKSLSDCTWNEIAEISESGRASELFAVGDEKDIVVSGETLTIAIMDFGHDDKSDGSGKAGITFGLKNLMATMRRMEATHTNANGFTGSEMYTWLQGELLSSLPTDLQSVLKFVDKKTSAGNQSTTINTDSMKLFLFSQVEVYGKATISAEGEGTQYSYFATSANRIKYTANGTGVQRVWWERSPYVKSTTVFCISSGTGTDYYGSSNSSGVCFGFCV